MSQTTSDLKRLSDRASGIKPAPTLAIASRARQMRAEGIDVISFSTGEPDFDTPPIVARAGIEAIENGFTHYTDATGTPELRDAVAHKFVEENGVPSSADRVMVSSGGKHAIFNVLAAIVDPGDNVIIQSPYWVSYPSLVSILGGQPRILDTTFDQGYKLTPEQLREAIDPQTKAIILNSPSNPTGVMYRPEELREFAEIARERGCYLLSDELYEKITYGSVDHFSVGSIDGMEDLVITINGVSKAWAMTGWRIGFATGPADVIRAAGAIQSQTTSNPCSISQMAALKAVRDGAGEAERLREAFERRRSIVLEELATIPGIRYVVPDGAFYVFVDTADISPERISGSLALSEYLLSEQAVAVVPGIAFGNDDGFRLSYACSDDDIVRGLARIREGLRSLTG